MSLSNYLENELLDHIAGVTFTAPAGTWVKLHLGDPGEDCTLNPAVEATRKSVSWAVASGGSMSATGSPVAEWTSVSTTETYSHFSVWDASTAGNALGYGSLSSSVAVTAGDTFQLTSLTWSLD